MKKLDDKKQSIIIYRDRRGNVELRTDIKKETIWATQAQIAELFDVFPQAVTRHLKNIYKEKELSKLATCSKIEQVQFEGSRKIKRSLDFYNLDAVIAIGYRVNSKKATRFRIWATKTLREYIIKGIAINTERIKKLHQEGLKDLRLKIQFIQNTIRKRELDKTEVDSLLSVISDYANSWLLLRKYDNGDLILKKGKRKEKHPIEYEFARSAIDELKLKLTAKDEAGDLFGNERDESFKGVLKTIYQTFAGQELYGSLEEKAAHLLYFLIKDHPFSDGNKRIGSFLFILFLDRNAMLYRKNREKKISDNTLVALALLIAESDPKEKEIMIALTTNLIA
ncbi:MAG: virulence protein RhuM/Fic/DOC family protein [bacterium]|nr:virulence protein RhuM/Fic/DOC family protein [bacterium]